MRRLLAVTTAAWLALAPMTAHAAGAAWTQGAKVAGIFDVDGPRTDGSLIVAGAGALYLLDPTGTLNPFARGPGGYHDDPGSEAYLSMSPGGAVSSAGCSFVPDETFLLRLHTPIGITRVSASGDESGSFANLTGVTGLNGIAFDTTGSFDHRLLVTGLLHNNTAVFAIDCSGAVQVLTRTAPRVEGGVAVAPSGFGSFGGALIAPDELSGKIYAIAPTGRATLIAKPALPAGPDTGVESVGFVPPGFMSRGIAVYYADRFTKGGKHPGNDKLLQLTADQLASAGVQEGDLLAATEGGATMVAVHCEASCKVIPVVAKATTEHGEGHLAFTMKAVTPSPSPAPPPATSGPSVPSGLAEFAGQWGIPIVAIGIFLGLVALLGVQALRRRGR